MAASKLWIGRADDRSLRQICWMGAAIAIPNHARRSSGAHYCSRAATCEYIEVNFTNHLRQGGT